MGLGDEIMALGRAERLYEESGNPVSILTMTEAPRDHEAWHGNPAWVHKGGKRLIDGGGARPYIKGWRNKQALFNLEYRARAGRVYLTDDERALVAGMKPPYAIVSPELKAGASPNKDWGKANWEQVIKDFPCPVYQLCPDDKTKPIKGAIACKTPSFRTALAVIEKAALVMAAEGGTHHMAASMRVPAVVVFGSFVPPSVTGYDFHYNIAVETDEGYCGRWEPCAHCRTALASITPGKVREKAILLWESYEEF